MHKVRYMALGGLLMFIGMLTTSELMPSLVAQRDKFGEIECTNLRVVDSDGISKVVLGIDQYGGRIGIADRHGHIRGDFAMSSIIGSDTVEMVQQEDDIPSVLEPVKRLNPGNLPTSLHVNGDVVFNNGVVSLPGLDITGDEVIIGGKDLLIFGGNLAIFKPLGKGKVAIGINEYGNGNVSTWDKNGYRQ